MFGFGRRCTREESIKSQEDDLSEFGRSFVLHYHQSWGQGLKERLDTLNKAVELAGIKAKFIQEGDKCGWTGDDIKELERARQFRKEIDDSFPIGSFEAEVCATIDIIKKYRDK